MQFNKVTNLTQADIHASNGYIHNIDGILLPDALLPILPHRCDIKTYRTVRVSAERALLVFGFDGIVDLLTCF